MPKVKVKRKSTVIDMTAMSDVTVLLLTFFMLTAVFNKKEAVQVTAPGSVSEIKIPDFNIMTILIEPTGKIFMSLDKPEERQQLLKKIGKDYNIEFSDEELLQFGKIPSFGVPIDKMKAFLALKTEEQDKIVQTFGIPNDSIDNQFKRWVQYSREINPDLRIAIKADSQTPYPVIRGVMNSLQELRENRYNLITNLKAGEAAK